MALAAVAPSFVEAQALTYTVDLTPDLPTFNRGGSGPNVPYVAIPITVTDGNNFSMVATGGTHHDAYMYVYSTFDPNQANLGIVLYDDDAGEGLLPAIGQSYGDPSIPNGNYTAVITAFSSGNYGTLIFDIVGITLNIGPTVEQLAQDLSLQYSNFLQSSGIRRNNAIAKAVRPSQSGATTSVSSKGHGAIAWGPAMRSGWVVASHDSLNGNVEGNISALQAGLDQYIQSGAILGASLSYDSISTSTAGTSAKGHSMTLQPYLGATLGSVDAIFSLAYSKTDYNDYVSGAVSGTANAESYEATAHFERSVKAANGMTLRPFASLSAGHAWIGFGGALAGAASRSFDYGRAVLGLEVTKDLAGGRFMDGSRVYGRLSATHLSSNAPDTSFAISGAAEGGNSASLALGANLVFSANSAFQIEARADGLGQGKPDLGISGGLKISF